MAENLPRMCESKCGIEQYGCKDGDFRLNTTGIISVARLYLDKQYVSLRRVDLQYLLKMFHVVQNQLNHVLSYVTVSLLRLHMSNLLIAPVSTSSIHNSLKNSKQYCKNIAIRLLQSTYFL